MSEQIATSKNTTKKKLTNMTVPLCTCTYRLCNIKTVDNRFQYSW